MAREPGSRVVDRGQSETETPATNPLVSPGFRGSRGGRPMPSHGRGHWFETSIAHPDVSPSQSRFLSDLRTVAGRLDFGSGRGEAARIPA